MKTASFDVVVLGAGCAGCCAAIAAARDGARTVLVERLGFPGGTSTAVLDTFYAFFTAGDAPRKVVAGLPDEPVARLTARGKAFARPNSFGSGTGYTYDPETLKIVWAELLREAGVKVMLHSFLIGAEVEKGVVRRAMVATKAGLLALEAPVFVDATGDADLVALAGGATLDDVELRQPATLTFRMAPVDTDLFQSEGRPRFKELVREGREAGFELGSDSGSLHRSGVPGVVLTATTRLEPPDLNDPLDSGRLELEGLPQVDEWARFLKAHVPGFAAAEISSIGATAGVRETRRVRGRYVLEEDDVLGARAFDDQVALCGAPIEDLASPDTRWVHVPDGGAYGIPWRCLLPEGLDNVAVAGRCLSATHAAHASARSMGTCMALGQAAGLAAATAVAAGEHVSAVDGAALRLALGSRGAEVGLEART